MIVALTRTFIASHGLGGHWQWLVRSLLALGPPAQTPDSATRRPALMAAMKAA